MLDPINNGNEIFQNILSKYSERIANTGEIGNLIEEIIRETQTWVIVDYLDYGCWDRLSKIEINPENGLLYLIESESPRGYTPQKDGLALKFKDALLHSNSSWSGIFIRGHAISKKTIKKILRVGATNFSFSSYNNRNFAVSIERDCNGVKENFDIFHFPIYSIAIIPKNAALNSLDSQELLFAINFMECLNRLEARRKQLFLIDESDEDSICEKANTGRRIFEFVLKVECNILEHKASFFGYDKPNETLFTKEYDKLFLGDLKQMIYKFKPKDKQIALGEIILVSNKLSHDSGDIVRKQEALSMLDLMIQYTTELYEIVQDHSLTLKHYTSSLQKNTNDSLESILKITHFSHIKINKQSNKP